MKLSGAKIILESLISHGADTVFGYPGGSVLDLYDALYSYKSKITHILTCHEQGACHAADGYARASGKTGVVIATSGPGATNLVTGIANAHMDSIPLVAITGNVAISQLGRDSFQEIDITGITMPITKQNYIVKDIATLEEIIDEAFMLASSGRKGPVLIDIPKNIFTEKADFKNIRHRTYSPPKADTYKTEEIAALIENTKKPLIFAGGGIISANAGEILTKFAEKIHCPVAFSLMGLSAMPANHTLNLGFVGMHGHMRANTAMRDADLLIAIGSRFSDRVATNRTMFASGAKIVHIDIDNAEIDKNITSALSVVADAKDILEVLNTKCKTSKHSEWLEYIYSKQNNVEVDNESYALNPQNVISCIQRMTDDGQIIATDVGQHQMWVAQSYSFMQPRTLITSGGLGAMGFGMGAAIGAHAATGKPIFLITGDGSFHMNMNEFATAVKNNLKIIVVVMNNNTLGMVRQLQKMYYNGHYSETTLNHKTDYVKLAEAFGGLGLRISENSQIESAIAQAIDCPIPVIIDVTLCEDLNVLPMIPSGKSVDDIILSVDKKSKNK